ncbi:hypothetical protein ACQKWADRAFT_323833 [Trichoderma austrokoningii]
MRRPRRPKTEEEVEAEVRSFGLTNKSAAAIVRLGNTLKRVRKLEREHVELPTPGRRLHSPSPLSQLVWKQGDIEDSRLPGLEAGMRSRKLEASSAIQAETAVGFEPFNGTVALFISWLTLYVSVKQDSSSGVSETPPISRFRRRALSPIQEEDEDEGVKQDENKKEEVGSASSSKKYSAR